MSKINSKYFLYHLPEQNPQSGLSFVPVPEDYHPCQWLKEDAIWWRTEYLRGWRAASTSGNSVFYFNIILPFGLQFLPPCPDTMSKAFLKVLNKKWVIEKFMQSLHPPPHTNPFYGTTRKQVPREKTSLWASKLISYQPPVPASGSEVLKQKGVSWQTGRTKGPEWGSAHLEKGSAQQGQ